MKMSAVIVSWNVKDLLKKCILSVLDNTEHVKDMEIIVVDNASADGSADMVASTFPSVKLIRNLDNVGFSRANNQGIEASSGEYVLLLNPDTEVRLGAVDKLCSYLDRNTDTAGVAPKLLNADGSLQRSILGFPTLGAMAARQLFVEYLWPDNPWSKAYNLPDHDYGAVSDVDQPMGACILFRRSALEEAHGFDAASFMFFDEVDLCFRIKKAGWKIRYIPDAEVVHYGGSSVKKWGAFNLSRHWTRSRNLFFRKHYGAMQLAALYLADALRAVIIIALLIVLIASIPFFIEMLSF